MLTSVASQASSLVIPPGGAGNAVETVCSSSGESAPHVGLHRNPVAELSGNDELYRAFHLTFFG